MFLSRRSALACALALAPMALVNPAIAVNSITAPTAQSIVTVSLWDKGADAMSNVGDTPQMGYGMAKAYKIAKAPVGITASITSVPAGEVTFKVTNDSKEMIHEMIVSPVAHANRPLPFDADLNKVDEDAAGHLGEVSELDPGKSGALTLTLKPGTYILFCNIPGHYASGMWTVITVKG